MMIDTDNPLGGEPRLHDAEQEWEADPYGWLLLCAIVGAAGLVAVVWRWV